MDVFIVFDNNGKTPDRFTIINKETGDVFGASENPAGPGGIAKFCGNCADHKIVLYGAGWRQKLPPKKIIQAEVENYINNAKLNADWLGAEVATDRLSQGVRDYIARLMEQTLNTQDQMEDQFSIPFKKTPHISTLEKKVSPA